MRAASWPSVSVHSVALGNFVFAYNCHLNVCPVAAELEVPTGERIHKVTYTAVFVQIFFYLGIAICGYLSFGTGTESDILLNYDADDPWAIVSRYGFMKKCILVLFWPQSSR